MLTRTFQYRRQRTGILNYSKCSKRAYDLGQKDLLGFLIINEIYNKHHHPQKSGKTLSITSARVYTNENQIHSKTEKCFGNAKRKRWEHMISKIIRASQF